MSQSASGSMKTIVAFAVIYLVWGSTFLAIRIGVQELPPLLFAALRFLTAGILLSALMLVRGVALPTRRQAFSIVTLAILIFVVDYGLLFWAEQRVTSGVAAVIMATIPAFTAFTEILLLRTQRLTFRLAVALTGGLLGVAALTLRSLHLTGSPIDGTGALALLVASLAWSVASVLSRKLPLPASRPFSAGAQMLAGGLMLSLASAAHGDFRTFHPAAVSPQVWAALAYLIVFGSLVGFTAYVWLIHHHSPTRVGTYAYVNPLVAVLLGFFVAHEPIGLRTFLGTGFILFSVVLITTSTRNETVKRLPSTPSARLT